MATALKQVGFSSAELVDTANIPGGGTLRLMRHGEDFAILFGEEQLMGSWVSGSEEALATLAYDRLKGVKAPRFLIGGLGMGFTLAATLAVVPASATVMVAELVPQVVRWANGHLAHVFGASLEDPRVSLKIRDVHDVIVNAPGTFDAILLDVDNGPDAVISLANDRLYCNWGLRAAYSALRPGGVLAIWSAYGDDDFLARLEKTGFTVEEINIRADGVDQGPHHVIWLATRLA